MTPADTIIKAIAEDMGVGDTFSQTPVGVFFGEPGKTVPDPYFGGAGPERTGCIECGDCMVGCRYGAKNTLVKNYLGLAERAGATVHPLTTVASLQQRPDGVWNVDTVRTGAVLSKKRQTFTAPYVVVAAGTWGTQNLLHKMKDTGTLPQLSDQLGMLTRTNSESILGAMKYKVDPTLQLTHGVAITSSIHPTGDTHIEPVRYGKGSNLMGMLMTLMTDGGGRWPRWLKFLAAAAKNPAALLRVLTVKNWSERTVITLVMQNLDNSIATSPNAGCAGVTCRASKATASPIRRGSRSATKRPAGSPRRSTGCPPEAGVNCSTSR